MVVTKRGPTQRSETPLGKVRSQVKLGLLGRGQSINPHDLAVQRLTTSFVSICLGSDYIHRVFFLIVLDISIQRSLREAMLLVHWEPETLVGGLCLTNALLHAAPAATPAPTPVPTPVPYTSAPSSYPGSSWSNTDAYKSLERTNMYRRRHGSADLTWADWLVRHPLMHAQDQLPCL